MSDPDGSSSLEWFMTEVLVDDWPESVRWYVEALGLRLTLRDDANGFALLTAGDGRLALKRNLTGDETAGRSRVRLVFRVDDLDATRNRLVTLGIPVSDPTENVREAYREVRLTDPAGTPITLFQWTRPGR